MTSVDVHLLNILHRSSILCRLTRELIARSYSSKNAGRRCANARDSSGIEQIRSANLYLKLGQAVVMWLATEPTRRLHYNRRCIP